MALTDTDLSAAQAVLDADAPPGYTVEILAGALFLNPPAENSHNDLAREIHEWLAAHHPDVPPLVVSSQGDGVWSDGEWQQRDVIVRSKGTRTTGTEVALAVEVVSDSNRRLADYEAAVAERAVRYGIALTLVVDPAKKTGRWFANGAEVEPPEWATGLVDAVSLG